MRYIIYGKNLEVTEGLKQAVHDKFSKLEKFFTPETEVQVTLSVQKDNQIVEATIPMKGTILRVEPNSTDMYVSIDLVEEVIERQLRKYKTKIIGKHKDGGNLRKEFIEKENEGEEEEVKIIRTKQFGMKPMFPEDACVQMELLGHSFFVFRNADTDEVNVVYKRKGNTYGLIEPEC
jgi:putative sigma-54 modulation protein